VISHSVQTPETVAADQREKELAGSQSGKVLRPFSGTAV
jgi:hypothetical protein